MAKRYRKLNPYKGRTSATTGAISELRVAVDLMVKGYDVFRALSPSCSCDLAVILDEKLYRIEVRTSYIISTGIPNRSKNKHGDSSDKADIWAWVTPVEIIYEPELPVPK